jgi:hypothetical protein
MDRMLLIIVVFQRQYSVSSHTLSIYIRPLLSHLLPFKSTSLQVSTSVFQKPKSHRSLLRLRSLCHQSDTQPGMSFPPIRFAPFQVSSVPPPAGATQHSFYQPQTSGTTNTSGTASTSGKSSTSSTSTTSNTSGSNATTPQSGK